MEKENTRLSRLTAIITQLQSKRIITATFLADKHKVSVRTIYRDIRALEKSGVPVITEEGKGYSLQEGYKLPPVTFTENEANALITAAEFIKRNKDASLVENYENAISKIKSVLKYSQRDKVDLLSQRIIIRNNIKEERTSSYLMRIQSAITSYQLLKIEYKSLQNKETKRIIEPFALYSTQENWLLIAFCRLRNEFRAFRIDCIGSLNVKEEVFEPHNMTLEEYFKICKQKYINTPDILLS